MEWQLKQRLVGTAVLAILAVIFLPMLLDGPQSFAPRVGENPVPTRPLQFRSPIEPLQPLPPLPEQPVIAQELVEEDIPMTAQPTVGEQPVVSAAKRGDASPSASSNPASTLATTGRPLRAWIIQVGSFRNEKNARELRNKLREKGYPAFVEEASRAARIVYRVRVGPELSRQRADSIRSELVKSLKLKGIVVAYPQS